MSGLDRMKQRFQYMGGNANGRNIEGKLRSFHTALKNSYQSEWITLHKGEETEKRVLCLINPSRLTEEFDKKVLSIDFEHGVKEGDVFYWDRTEKYWKSKKKNIQLALLAICLYNICYQIVSIFDGV